MEAFQNISGLAIEIIAGLIATAVVGCLAGWFWGKFVNNKPVVCPPKGPQAPE